jgi:aubergine-like protein
MNMSVASNIMKQINSKLGGESVRVKLPSFMAESRTMIVGIDVCHASKNSVVGVVASTNPHATAFYQDIIIQAKNQEIVKKDLDRVYGSALRAFKNQSGDYPERIIIFRDGVGDAMRQQVIDCEITQLRAVLASKFEGREPPKITLVVVNKRINQRMFVREGGHEIRNPAPGVILDANLVENTDGNVCFDFFLVSQLATQGCVTPTHFFVPLNESLDVSKEDFENLTFSLSFMYSNWSGSIKVPSLCQLAHKLAEFHHSFDKHGALKKVGKNIDLRQLAYNDRFLDHCYYL